MNDAPFVWIHGIEAERDARNTHLFRRLFGHQSQLFLATCPVPGRIKYQLGIFPGASSEYAIAQVFERIEQLGIVPKQQGDVVTANLYLHSIFGLMEAG